MESDDVSYGTDGVGFGRDGHESVGSNLYTHNATHTGAGAQLRHEPSNAERVSDLRAQYAAARGCGNIDDDATPSQPPMPLRMLVCVTLS